MDDDHEDGSDDARAQRLGVGIALGLPFGAALSMILDNWGFVGVGLLFGIVFGAIPPRTGDDSDPEA